MDDPDIWLILFHAALNDPEASAESAAKFADEAFDQYKKRWPSDDCDAE